MMIACMIAPRAWAQDDVEPVHPPPPPPPSAPSTIDITFTPGAWLTRINGEARLGPSPAAQRIRVEEAFDLDSYQAIFNGELSITKDNFYELKFSGFDFAADSTGTFAETAVFGSLNLDPGDEFHAEFEMTSMAVELGLWLWQPYCIGPMPDGRECRVAMRAGPVFGARWIDIDHTVTIVGEGTETGQGEWLAPFAGVQFEMRFDTHDSVPLIDVLAIEGGGVLGPALGGENGAMAQIHAGLTAYFTPNFAAGFGYRLTEVDVGYDDFEFTGGLQGLFVFASLRF
jgi:hypothetical protein